MAVNPNASLSPKRLLELLRIAEHGSYTRAAAAQGVSQPALSNSIAALEQSLGVRLVDRTPHGSSLTDLGQLLAGHATALEALLTRAADDVTLRKQGLAGSLVIGVSPIASAQLVPAALARLKAETPGIAVTVTERPDDDLMAGLRTGQIDVVVSPAGLQADPPDIERELLIQDRFVIVAGPKHPAAGRQGVPAADRKGVPLKALRGAQWVMPDAHTAMYRQIELLFAAENEPWPRDCICTNSITALKALLMGGDFVTISSAAVVRPELDAGYLAATPLRNRSFSREITLRTRRNAHPSAVVQRFVTHLRAVAAALNRSPAGARQRRAQAGG